MLIVSVRMATELTEALKFQEGAGLRACKAKGFAGLGPEASLVGPWVAVSRHTEVPPLKKEREEIKREKARHNIKL